MSCSPEEWAQRDRLEELYVRAQAPVMRSIERRVCGCDYGGSSWTTRDEAERIGAILGLRPGLRLLDVGAGSGWPALYLAKKSGCDVALVDLPLSGLRIASQRALDDGVSQSCWIALADAASLPFGDANFDAVSHSDALCCLREKRAVLEACRRVIRDGELMAFSVISVAPGLSHDDYRRAVDNGPEFIESETDYPTMLGQTGWIVLDCQDITGDYAASIRRQLGADEEREDGLKALIGPAEFAERQAEWRSKLAAVDERLLRRELFVARPDSGRSPGPPK
jgi:cyclopropane fatty-acyl-phospholipid synthase-like methyltransferase